MRCATRAATAALLGVLAVLMAPTLRAQQRSCMERTPYARQGAPDFAMAAARQGPAVVGIAVSGWNGEWTDAAGQADGSLRPSSAWGERDARGLASGFIVRDDGYILTSAHAVIGAQRFAVSTADHRHFEAEVVGFDRRTDVALLKIAGNNLPVVTPGRSARLCPGEWVAAMGAPFGFDRSVTAGVVSANPRYMPGGYGVALIQTDVALNPGNSGGPLFDARGDVVGMNSMIYSPSGGYLGVSFSLPIDTALRIADELRTSGHVTRSHLGARTQPLTAELASAFGLGTEQGALVVRVDPGSPAERAGLRSGDVVLAVEAAAPMTYADIQERVSSARPGSRLALNVWRHRAALPLQVSVVASAPDVVPASVAGDAKEVRLGLELVERKGPPGIGSLDPGLYVKRASGSAQQAGLRFGDAVLAVNDTSVSGLQDFDAALRAAGDGNAVALLVMRGSAHNFVAIAPTHRAAALPARGPAESLP
jgi:serine protease Do